MPAVLARFIATDGSIASLEGEREGRRRRTRTPTSKREKKRCPQTWGGMEKSLCIPAENLAAGGGGRRPALGAGGRPTQPGGAMKEKK